MPKYRHNLDKAKDEIVTYDFLQDRYERACRAGYEEKAKWILFCEQLLEEEYTLYLYEAQQTYSKYITVYRDDSMKTFKVRFSNHKPLLWRELSKDCDFFVGVTNRTVTTTEQALEAVRRHFGKGDK